ncbi:SDR family oxidoreductase [Shewanella sp. 3_MG-2023]|uniref:UDP-glucose 4-epimerase family protein n=1 Tax=Shewanella sp. 3_MG-2023 TaxID=3062635 RepID=UPI0026E2D100|nr:SDR family oxidoreductase [Shewanella sp. 3_MG-2023]MDO6776588.1 SDR family oxidoreductase [Shewanella sp. 3_MG-2023]
MFKVLLTGYSGFVGSYLLHDLQINHIVSLLGRKEPNNNILEFYQSELDKLSNFKRAVASIDVVIHCAARAHVMGDEAQDPLAEFRKINTFGTLHLAKQAADAGVKRFIFISSIKVNGESTELGLPFKSNDAFIPIDPYGLSKYEAEVGLRKISEQTGMEVVIIRPPLVYGPGVKANFASLMNLVSKGLPLPFACISNNKRSLVSVNNLVDLIVTCIDHPKAANKEFLVSDDHDVSTADMIRYIGKALDKPSRMLPVPLWCYHLAGKIFGKKDVVDRLVGSLQVDITHTKETLNWVPPQSLEDGFKETAVALLESKNK